jgi:TRAP-type mannitol/chloroaromatic compound transport system substrate-binding protein
VIFAVRRLMSNRRQYNKSPAETQYILDKAGIVPAISDNDRYDVTNQKLTMKMLKEISDSLIM